MTRGQLCNWGNEEQVIFPLPLAKLRLVIFRSTIDLLISGLVKKTTKQWQLIHYSVFFFSLSAVSEVRVKRWRLGNNGKRKKLVQREGNSRKTEN